MSDREIRRLHALLSQNLDAEERNQVLRALARFGDQAADLAFRARTNRHGHYLSLLNELARVQPWQSYTGYAGNLRYQLYTSEELYQAHAFSELVDRALRIGRIFAHPGQFELDYDKAWSQGWTLSTIQVAGPDPMRESAGSDEAPFLSAGYTHADDAGWHSDGPDWLEVEEFTGWPQDIGLEDLQPFWANLLQASYHGLDPHMLPDWTIWVQATQPPRVNFQGELDWRLALLAVLKLKLLAPREYMRIVGLDPTHQFGDALEAQMHGRWKRGEQRIYQVLMDRI